MNDFYTYAYLREDLSPYYIGKGRGKRAFQARRRIAKPKDRSRIAILRKNMSEEQAFKHECEIIKFFGRKDIGTGLLRNMTNGGEGASGHIWSDEHKANYRLALKSRTFGETRKKIRLARIARWREKGHVSRFPLNWCNAQN